MLELHLWKVEYCFLALNFTLHKKIFEQCSLFKLKIMSSIGSIVVDAATALNETKTQQPQCSQLMYSLSTNLIILFWNVIESNTLIDNLGSCSLWGHQFICCESNIEKSSRESTIQLANNQKVDFQWRVPSKILYTDFSFVNLFKTSQALSSNRSIFQAFVEHAIDSTLSGPISTIESIIATYWAGEKVQSEFIKDLLCIQWQLSIIIVRLNWCHNFGNICGNGVEPLTNIIIYGFVAQTYTVLINVWHSCCKLTICDNVSRDEPRDFKFRIDNFLRIWDRM